MADPRGDAGDTQGEGNAKKQWAVLQRSEKMATEKRPLGLGYRSKEFL